MIDFSTDAGSTLIRLSSGVPQGPRFPPVGPVGHGAMPGTLDANHGEENAVWYFTATVSQPNRNGHAIVEYVSQ